MKFSQKSTSSFGQWLYVAVMVSLVGAATAQAEWTDVVPENPSSAPAAPLYESSQPQGEEFPQGQEMPAASGEESVPASDSLNAPPVVEDSIHSSGQALQKTGAPSFQTGAYVRGGFPWGAGLGWNCRFRDSPLVAGVEASYLHRSHPRFFLKDSYELVARWGLAFGRFLPFLKLGYFTSYNRYSDFTKEHPEKSLWVRGVMGGLGVDVLVDTSWSVGLALNMYGNYPRMGRAYPDSGALLVSMTYHFPPRR